MGVTAGKLSAFIHALQTPAHFASKGYVVSFSDVFRSLWRRKKAVAPRKSGATLPVGAPPHAMEKRRHEEPSLGLPKFHTTAADHVDRGRPDPHARERVRLRNSFMPTQPVADPRMFAGRREILESLIGAVEDQRSHVVIYGDRGAGKTSLLRMLSRSAAEAKYIVAYFSCGATSDFDETFRAVAQEIPLLYHSGVSPIRLNAEVGTSLSDLLGPGRLTPRMFGDAAAKLVGTRVLVVLDEFDRAESPEFRRDVAELIKTLSDVAARLQLIIAGVASDLVDLMEHIPSIRRSISAVRVPAMSDQEVTALIQNGARMSGVKFDPAAADLVVLAAKGSPYLTNLLCHVAGIQALDAARVRVELSDVSRALEEVIEDFRRRLPHQLAVHLDKATESFDLTSDALNGVLEPAAKVERGGSRLPLSLSVSARVLEKLKKDGALEGANPAAYALMIDSVTPYLQLRSAHERFVSQAT